MYFVLEKVKGYCAVKNANDFKMVSSNFLSLRQWYPFGILLRLIRTQNCKTVYIRIYLKS